MAAAASKAAALLPKLKSKLVDASTGRLKSGLVQQVLGSDSENARQALIDAAESATQPEKVFYPEIRSVASADEAAAGAGAAMDASFADVPFVMVRESASLAALRLILRKALANTSFGTHATRGAYTFYLHDGKTRVDEAEEEALIVFDHVPGHGSYSA